MQQSDAAGDQCGHESAPIRRLPGLIAADMPPSGPAGAAVAAVAVTGRNLRWSAAVLALGAGLAAALLWGSLASSWQR